MNPRIKIWTNIPNHYQAALFEAVRSEGADLQVAYYDRVPDSRVALGWARDQNLPRGEAFVEPSVDSLYLDPAWRECIHLVPGYGSRFTLTLAAKLSQEGTGWVHWSERSHPGLRSLLTQPVKRAYAEMVNRFALGAFAIGAGAFRDFGAWGIRREMIAILPYSPTTATAVAADSQIQDFANGRPVFLYLGTLNRRKGIDVLINAFASSPSTWALALVGNDASGGEYARLARRLGVQDRVLFRGAMSPKSLGDAILAAKVVILPSRFDGWGVTLNEGASLGRALIGSDACGATEHLIVSGVNGFRVQAGSVGSLARALSAYSLEPELATNHGEASLEIFKANSPEVNAKKMLSTLATWAALSRSRQK